MLPIVSVGISKAVRAIGIVVIGTVERAITLGALGNAKATAFFRS